MRQVQTLLPLARLEGHDADDVLKDFDAFTHGRISFPLSNGSWRFGSNEYNFVFV